MLDQRPVGHGFAPKARVRHVGSRDEALNLSKQFGVCDDPHDAAKYHIFPTLQALMLGMYEIAPSSAVWDTQRMAAKFDKQESARASALDIARRLAAMPHPDSERQWTIDAGVSSSFFSNLRGTPTKAPADPSVALLRQMLKVRGVTLPEFFADEAGSKLLPIALQRGLERAFEQALSALPEREEDRPRYLATVVQGLLALPSTRPATADDADGQAGGVLGEGAPPRRANKRK